MTRRKGAAVDAPATREEAAKLAGDYAAAEHLRARVKAGYDAKIAALVAQRDAEDAAFEASQSALYARLKAWWSSQGAVETKGKAKSIKLAGVEIGTRTGNPALKLPKGVKAEAIIATLKASGKTAFIRLKEELEKPLIIAALRWTEPKAPAANDEESDARFIALSHRLALESMGLAVGQKEEFFIAVGTAEQPKIEEDVA